VAQRLVETNERGLRRSERYTGAEETFNMSGCGSALTFDSVNEINLPLSHPNQTLIRHIPWKPDTSPQSLPWGVQ
jgi:hypothetical protein